jgi:hypothetical protein
MAIMLAKTYAALKEAGASEDAAQAAAEEIAAYEERLHTIAVDIATIKGDIGKLDTKIGALDGRLKLLTWAIGINAAATIATFGMMWQLTSAIGQLTGIVSGLRH